MKRFLPFLVLALSSLPACGYGSKACAIIDAASQACVVVKYLAPDGTVHEVPVSPEELAAFGAQMAAKRASEGK